MDEFSARRLRNVISVLIEQRNAVDSMGDSFAGHLIDMAILQLRMTLHSISGEEMCEFSDFLSTGVADRHEHSQ
jgi:hypothetical protein